MHNDIKEIAQRINDNVALATTDFLASVVTAFITRPSGFDALTVDDASARIGSTSLSFSFKAGEREIELAPGAIVCPLAIVIVHAVVIRVLLGQVIPLATSTDEIVDGIDDGTHVQLNWASRPFPLRWQELLHQFPLFIGQVTRVLDSDCATM